MIKIIYAFIALMSLTSCVSSYDIEGTSNITMLDGRMLYLKVYDNNELKTLDSCDVVHGQFKFTGTVDSVRYAMLFMDNEGLMPVVLEDGKIHVNIDKTRQNAGGTPLNDKLSGFMEKYIQLTNRINELGREQSRAIMDGSDMDAVNMRLAKEADRIAEKEDKLVTSFIVDNFDNVLGPGIFFMMTADNTYPELSPWVEDIMSKATDKFKNDPYVKDYYEKACHNQNIMNGMSSHDVNAPLPATGAPTPNELARPR